MAINKYNLGNVNGNAYFSEAFKVAARKAWNIKTKDRTASSHNGSKNEKQR